MPKLANSYGNITEEVLDQGAPSRARHVCREFSQKMAGVIRPSAFRLHRLAQSPRRDLRPGHSCREFSEFLEFRLICNFSFLRSSGFIEAVLQSFGFRSRYFTGFRISVSFKELCRFRMVSWKAKVSLGFLLGFLQGLIWV